MNLSTALPRRLSNTVTIFQRLFLLFEQPWFALLFSLVFFSFITRGYGGPFLVTARAYFNYQADAWLHGQIALRVLPDSTLDLSLFHGRYYLYWGPLPSLLILPAVAMFGLSASDVFQSILFGSLNAALFALLLRHANRRGLFSLEPWQRALMVLFFTLGTSHTTLPAIGRVWFTAQIIVLTCVLLAYLAAFSLRDGPAFFWTGCAMAGVFLTRMSAILMGLFLVYYLLRRYWSCGWKRLLGFCALALLPLLAAFAFQGWYNAVRFGSPLESGMVYQLNAPILQPRFEQYGMLNLHYFPEDFYFTYLYHPLVDLLLNGRFLINGGSLFLLGPLFFAAFCTLWRDRRSLDHWMLWATFLLGNVPILLLITPTLQYGSRYALDCIVPLLLLTASGMRRWRGWLVFLLTAVSIFSYVLGAFIMLETK